MVVKEKDGYKVMADEVGMKNKEWIKEKLISNADKNFVQRLFKKDAPLMDLGKGNIATHQMSWAHTGHPKDPATKIIVYPNIVWNKERRGLEWKGDREAVDYAKKSGEYIEVESPEEAQLLSTEYKVAVPEFEDRTEPGRGGPGSMSYQQFETEEEKQQKKINMRKLGLLAPEPKKKKKDGK